jgi:hypothetical protein
MVDVHHALLREVSTMASKLYSKHGVQVAQEIHLKGRFSLRKEDEDKLKPNFSGSKAEQDMADLMAARHDSDESLRTSLEATIRAILDFMVQRGWKEIDGE